ncbi:phospholipase D-like domain-containing protein [Helicobacter cappadocius]|uniref:phospholipase D n=1 Tax=Helicobacter cappadocius TaxID=3063998 RepID=A0AA90PZ22_9HELI|nr:MULTISPECIES: phospholipase D-like domain-containing protein [unclassified Helicobacter]MDO7253362.1 phospholipase D-like domain-containing protein [Helicobacter sp. faydin-H75]MDP2539208.1 phospholipase D-like domain-containing protein [Helicobacter sp. faydin-H76]
MKNLFLKLTLIAIFLTTLNANDKLYFMPYEQKTALDVLIKSIYSSEENIDISIFSFTNRQIAKALKDMAKKGVKIRIIYDYESNVKNPYSTIGYLSKYNNISTCLLKGKRERNNKYDGIMHQKMAIIDTDIIIIGSANWSKNAFENNYELMLESNDKEMIKKAKSYFSKMFAHCKPY